MSKAEEIRDSVREICEENNVQYLIKVSDGDTIYGSHSYKYGSKLEDYVKAIEFIENNYENSKIQKLWNIITEYCKENDLKFILEVDDNETLYWKTHTTNGSKLAKIAQSIDFLSDNLK